MSVITNLQELKPSKRAGLALSKKFYR